VLLSRFSGDWHRSGATDPTIEFTRRRSSGWPSRDERIRGEAIAPIVAVARSLPVDGDHAAGHADASASRKG
jgi:hypothetical protein